MKPVLEHLYSDPTMLMFECPGCQLGHTIYVGEGKGPRWSWNGSLVAPTFSPSLKVEWHALAPEDMQRMEEYFAEHGSYPPSSRWPARKHHCCHSFIADGKIQFLADCTHALAGQTVPIPAIED